jgi:valyl-tRNA synthetase
MSKSLGTGVDPRTIIETIGADALRWTLLSQSGMNQEIRYSERRTEDARNFCNKIWNASKFVMMNIGEEVPNQPDSLDEVDQWLLSRLAATEAIVRQGYSQYDFQTAANALYSFFWSDYCDWYVEVSKARLSDESQRHKPRWVLLTALEAFLKMLHPIMPFITDEVYSYLPLAQKDSTLMKSKWPSGLEAFSQPQVEERVETWFEITRAVRTLRAEVGMGALKEKIPAFFEGDLLGGELVIRSQSGLSELTEGKPTSKCVSTTVKGISFHLPIEGLFDPAKERERLNKELEKLGAELAKLNQRLENPQFIERAKPEIVEKERATAADLQDKMERTKERMALMGD